MHLFHIPQSTIGDRNVYVAVLIDALWDIEQVYCWVLWIFSIATKPHASLSLNGIASVYEACPGGRYLDYYPGVISQSHYNLTST